jgi:hypothetical protein
MGLRGFSNGEGQGLGFGGRAPVLAATAGDAAAAAGNNGEGDATRAQDGETSKADSDDDDLDEAGPAAASVKLDTAFFKMAATKRGIKLKKKVKKTNGTPQRAKKIPTTLPDATLQQGQKDPPPLQQQVQALETSKAPEPTAFPEGRSADETAKAPDAAAVPEGRSGPDETDRNLEAEADLAAILTSGILTTRSTAQRYTFSIIIFCV